MSEPVYHRWQAMFGGGQAGGPKPAPGALFSVAGLDAGQAMNLDYLAALLRNHLDSQPETAGLVLEIGPGELRIPLPDTWSIPVDGSAMQGDGRRALFFLGAALARIGNRIDIIGRATHSRSRFVPALHLRRALWVAVTVAETLVDAGIDRPVAARGQVSANGPEGLSVEVVIRDWQEN